MSDAGAVWQGRPVHLDNVLRRQQRIDKASKSGTRRRQRSPRRGRYMPGLGAGQLGLTLQVCEGDVEIDHGHLGRSMAE